MSTAESSFDEEVPASEIEQLPDFNADVLASAAAQFIDKPMSRKKMKLFIELSNLELEQNVI